MGEAGRLRLDRCSASSPRFFEGHRASDARVLIAILESTGSRKEMDATNPIPMSPDEMAGFEGNLVHDADLQEPDVSMPPVLPPD